ncbi:hypothetical protein BDV27DRAFT_81111 [Aspergillus caelatus]|uniref:Uncharacterized protein n=2 Tax=Aspergillus subgen. Circumdati TaxID=2720871 RepID=A0A5N7ACL8_9EURO|nr:uncharacterized protein BDV27DRAFT_81111 [Aspergillus caelatus]KAE8367088.1 hypothetical protein BDV27DRAFT_81111 [Aspergillus caelatus]KAE8421307.1 hypothetical protein BDV36DRAFT_292501 [Aspergillus pseudocaelatus]
MDPFSRLPWFVLRKILCSVPDLPTLYNLHNASPVIAAFLHENDVLFRTIVDTIITKPILKRGLLPEVLHSLKVLIVRWNKQLRFQQNMEIIEPDSEFESLHQQYENNIGFPDLDSPLSVSETREGIIPRSTASVVLCRLLALMTRIQRPVHACFQPSVARCLTERRVPSPSHLHTRAIRFFNTRPVVGPPSKQLKGVPVGPPTWFEEQRLVSVLLHVVVSYEFREAYNASYYLAPATLQLIQGGISYDIEGFCDQTSWSRYEQSQRLGELLTWLEEQAGSKENMHTWLRWVIVPDNLGHSCY